MNGSGTFEKSRLLVQRDVNLGDEAPEYKPFNSLTRSADAAKNRPLVASEEPTKCEGDSIWHLDFSKRLKANEMIPTDNPPISA